MILHLSTLVQYWLIMERWKMEGHKATQHVPL